LLVEEFIEIKIGNNVKHYESLEYQIPKYKDGRNRMSVKRGTKIIVKIKDIPRNTDIHIPVKCDYCGEDYNPKIVDYYNGHKTIDKDSCNDCKHIKIQEVLMFKYGTTSLKTRSEIEGFKIGRNKKDGEEVYNNFIIRGYIPQFAPDDYKGCEEKLPYICPKHKEKGILYISYASFLNNNSGCIHCAYEINNEAKRYSVDYVDESFTNKNYTLHSKNYTNVDNELEYTCNYHPEEGIQKTTFWHVLTSTNNCKICRYNMQSGELHYNWQGGISSERDLLKHKAENETWRKTVYAKDNYTCQVCGKTHCTLNAHHIFNWSSYPDLRYEINNGITLCEECHAISKLGSFHNVYGTHNNTKEQLDEYIQRYKSCEFDEIRKRNIVNK